MAKMIFAKTVAARSLQAKNKGKHLEDAGSRIMVGFYDC